jgi:hypothetical protein
MLLVDDFARVTQVDYRKIRADLIAQPSFRKRVEHVVNVVCFVIGHMKFD